MALINTGCSAQKNIPENNVDGPGSNKQPIEDSILRKLQTENDLVIAYAVENFAWVRSIDYRIIAQKNNEWKGYNYHLNLMRGSSAGSPTVVTEAVVNKESCNSVLNYINENKAWAIPGDSGDGFCNDGNTKCNINDAASARLWIITKNTVVNPSYYAPEFFEKCCPDKQRGLFLSITKKIAAIFGSSNDSE
ncbi:MAG: hypothetical protein ABI405_06255 [Parafilimonas sp.]